MDWNLERQIKTCVGRTSKAQRTAMLAALVGGVIVHFPALVGGLYNHDSWPTEILDWMISQGKWFHAFWYRHDCGIYPITLAVFTSLIAIALASGMLVYFFRIKSSLWGGMLGAVLVAFPSVMCGFAYQIGFWYVFLAALALYCIRRFPSWKGWTLGTVIMVFTLGLYPPSVGFLSTGLLYLCCEETLRDGSDIKSIIKRSALSLFVLVVSLCGYYVMLKILLKVENYELVSYQNIDHIADLDLISVIKLFPEGYKFIFDTFFFDARGTGSAGLVWLYRIALAALLCGTVWLIKVKHLLTQPFKLLSFLLFACLCPLSMNLVYIINQGVEHHWIMMYPFVMLFLLLIKIIDYAQQRKLEEESGTDRKKAKAAGYFQQYCGFLLVACIVYNWAVIDGTCYHRMRISFYGAYDILTNIVEDIYECPDYEPGKVVALVGYPSFPEMNDIFSEYNAYTGVQPSTFLFNYEGVFERLTQVWLQRTFRWGPAGDEILNSDEFLQMPVYPSIGYVNDIDGVLVVKLGDG